MLRRLYLLSILLLIAACEPTAVFTPAPTAVPFPTVTPGRTIFGLLPDSSQNSSGLSNPATAMALASQPTATPDYTTCPEVAAPPLGSAPSTGREIASAMTSFLNAGGSARALENALRDDWALLGDTGIVRSDLDLTGEGSAEIVATFSAPDDAGTLLIFGCTNGRYMLRHEAVTGGSTPQIIHTGDMNFNPLPELLFTSQRCDEQEVCTYQTQILTWNGNQGRFVSLTAGPLNSLELPAVSDVDNDHVLEVVVRLTSRGTSESGPLRTGVTIYDWNGVIYTLSITQLDPPRYRIQVVHEADRQFGQREVDTAIPLYELALTDTELRNWFDDDQATLHSYTLYRLLLAYAYTEDERRLETFQTIMQTYPDPATAPIFAQMGTIFWNSLQVTNNLHSACLEVQAIIAAQPQALALLNRYGSRSPTYTAQDLCPF